MKMRRLLVLGIAGWFVGLSTVGALTDPLAKVTREGCVAESSDEDHYRLTDTSGESIALSGYEALAEHVGHHVLVVGEWQGQGDDRTLRVESLEDLGVCPTVE